MSRSLQDLHPEARPLFEALISRCRTEGIEALIVFTKRSPLEQAALWRQSRSAEEVQKTIQRLQKGTVFQQKQAEYLIKAGPSSGPWVTNALPLESAHQWGLAIDLCPLVGGKAAWDRIDLFKRMGSIGKSLGLVWGGDWRKKDWGHFEIPNWTQIAKQMLGALA